MQNGHDGHVFKVELPNSLPHLFIKARALHRVHLCMYLLKEKLKVARSAHVSTVKFQRGLEFDMNVGDKIWAKFAQFNS